MPTTTPCLPTRSDSLTMTPLRQQLPQASPTPRESVEWAIPSASHGWKRHRARARLESAMSRPGRSGPTPTNPNYLINFISSVSGTRWCVPSVRNSIRTCAARLFRCSMTGTRLITLATWCADSLLGPMATRTDDGKCSRVRQKKKPEKASSSDKTTAWAGSDPPHTSFFLHQVVLTICKPIARKTSHSIILQNIQTCLMPFPQCMRCAIHSTARLTGVSGQKPAKSISLLRSRALCGILQRPPGGGPVEGARQSRWTRAGPRGAWRIHRLSQTAGPAWSRTAVWVPVRCEHETTATDTAGR